MEIALTVVAFMLLAVGVAGSILPAIPGPPLSFIGLLVMHFGGRGEFSVPTLVLWAGIAIVVTIMDIFLPAMMTKRFGGSRTASIGSVIGLLLGIIIFPPLGIILGPFLGAFVGELIQNSKDGTKALKVALGALLAFAVGTGAKLVVSSVMLFLAIMSMF